MSRRPSDPSDLRPGNEPGASGRPGANGRPPAPPPGPPPGHGGWRPGDGRGTGPSPGGGGPGERRGPTPSSPSLRWILWVVLALIAAAFLVSSLANSGGSSKDLTYSQFTKAVNDGEVKSIEYNKSTGSIDGKFKQAVDGTKDFSSSGPKDNLNTATLKALQQQNVDVKYVDSGSSLFSDVLLYLLPLVLIVGLFVWLSRRAQGQMGAVMNIGRSRAKVCNTEKPKTTFADVAGYGPVKQEIAEVVDFLKFPQKFKQIGARIPKGVLLVGPPGTGKTLIARAVAGEAGVPFISITGSDFMEVFVGVGAARVRDLFQTARKQAPAIIFVDEIDSIGRKRGAGLGGGHDEREQTLNQML